MRSGTLTLSQRREERKVSIPGHYGQGRHITLLLQAGVEDMALFTVSALGKKGEWCNHFITVFTWREADMVKIFLFCWPTI